MIFRNENQHLEARADSVPGLSAWIPKSIGKMIERRWGISSHRRRNWPGVG